MRYEQGNGVDYYQAEIIRQAGEMMRQYVEGFVSALHITMKNQGVDS